MRLDRNEKGRGKYAIINLRKYAEYPHLSGAVMPSPRAIVDAMMTLEKAGLIEYGEPNTENEFFVVKLKDENARGALIGYYEAMEERTPQLTYRDPYADDILELADRAGPKSPWCKKPD